MPASYFGSYEIERITQKLCCQSKGVKNGKPKISVGNAE
jgi:uncharacterized Zn-finger protein